MALEDASKYANPRVPENRGAEWIHHWIGNSVANLTAGVAEGQSIPAYANHGRWIADCPDCHEAQLACRTDLRFMCNNCGNAAIGGLWRTVDWPAKQDKIENALKRRGRKNQNWFPRETVEDLVDENVKHEGGESSDLGNPKNVGGR